MHIISSLFSLPARVWNSLGASLRCFAVALVLIAASALNLRAGTVVLDPGHGGYDPGGVPRQRYSEKAAALDIALRVRAGLVARGHRVVMTRAVMRHHTFRDKRRQPAGNEPTQHWHQRDS